MGDGEPRLTRAVHARSDAETPQDELDEAAELRDRGDQNALMQRYGEHAFGMSDVDARMRRVLWRALAKSCGTNLRVGIGALFRNIETFDIGGPRIHWAAELRARVS